MKSFALRRLKALKCPLLDTIDIADTSSLCNVVCWLEDVKIRRYDTASRSFLRHPQNLFLALNQYLKDLGVPEEEIASFETLESKIYFLIDFAVDLCFKDLIEERKDDSLFLSTNRVVDGIELDEDLCKELYEVGSDLGVADPENLVGTLQVLVDLLRKGFQLDSLKKAGTSPQGIDDALLKCLRDEVPSGFSTGDDSLDDTCRLFRLLYLKDLKKLQATINKVIFELQTQTANPKTDTSRACIGR
ncbi:hypothetical protein Gasu_30900 isoform 1 [Galdieria sulphuraria]|uniref:Uncharacterized protein n=1 Tax=Galdieria sulphuraria TaxID=130081 RepID=M2XH95_GALSU|nr:hypothetical protein Gasu_30900 isoform 1 [Galdieria sulphuraria]EME29447.1 hypothetical protein isoform 1 [Galdieria sulphuraria]|eukprot:XP_005705967.1 hypothetical protein isoform 1 [Galdieria sulphuraria]